MATDKSLPPVWAELSRMARRWRRTCGRPGGASCQHEWANDLADGRVKACVKELEAFIKERSTARAEPSECTCRARQPTKYCPDCGGLGKQKQ